MNIDLKRYMEKRVYPYVGNSIRENLESLMEPIISKKRSIIKNKIPAVVGLSGGADSIATLFLAKKMGFDPIAVTLEYGSLFYNHNYRKNIKTIVKKLGVKSIFVPIDKKYFRLITKDLKNDKKPCKLCVKIKVKQLENICKKRRISFLIIGDMASRNNPIEVINKRLVRINLPSLFRVNESNMIDISKKVIRENVIYACPVPSILKRYDIKLNDEQKVFWIKKLLNWRENLDKLETLELLKNVVDS